MLAFSLFLSFSVTSSGISDKKYLTWPSSRPDWMGLEQPDLVGGIFRTR